MCGINGIFSISGNPLPGNVYDLINIMNHDIAHRGPDDAGIFIDHDRGISLGHRRLSIIDLSESGHQPMSDAAGNQIVFNGEIYNYRALKSAIKNHPFTSESDTEVLLYLLSNQGRDALQMLKGMFAFAFYNKEKEELLLARDPAGKKPLYYTSGNGYFAFASEIKALLSLPWVKNIPDKKAVYNFLTFNQLDAPQTMFENIFKLEPGSFMVVGKEGIIVSEKWWDVQYDNLEQFSENELCEKILDSLERSVSLRMVADVPVGAFLSGGVDSSAVVALMRNLSSSTIKTYSVGFDQQPDYDERKYAEKVSSMFKTEHHERIVTAEEIADYMPVIAETFSEPLADATSIPIYFISKLARENKTIVVQTGDGADELFAGYRNYLRYKKYYPWFNAFKMLPTPVKYSVAAASRVLERESPVGEMLYRGYRNEEFFWGGAKSFKENNKNTLLEPSFASATAGLNSYSVIEKHRRNFELLKKDKPELNEVDWMCYLGFKFQVPNKYLHRMDHLGMINSVEVRTPFLDKEMIRLALSVKPGLKIKNGEPKYILKKSLEKILPSEILYRKKMGFCVPLREWASSVMTDYIKSNLDEFCSIAGIFKKEAILEQVRLSENGNTKVTNNLWTVFFLMAWYRRWIS